MIKHSSEESEDKKEKLDLIFCFIYHKNWLEFLAITVLLNSQISVLTFRTRLNYSLLLAQLKKLNSNTYFSHNLLPLITIMMKLSF